MSPSRVAVILWLVVIGLAAGTLQAQLQPGDLQRLAGYADYWLPADTLLDTLPVERRREREEAMARARQEFAGRAADVARHFLTHTDYQVRNEAYWFVLAALADETAGIELVRALAEPPPVEAGVMARYEGEIVIALESMLTVPQIAGSRRVRAALIRMVESARDRPEVVDRAIPLLGRLEAPEARAALFPVSGEGWELLFEPIGAGILAGFSATVLLLIDRLVLERFVPRDAS